MKQLTRGIFNFNLTISCYASIHPLNKYSLNTFYVLNPGRDLIEDLAMIQKNSIPAPTESGGRGKFH